MPLVVVLDSQEIDLERDVYMKALSKYGFDISSVDFRGINCRTQDEVMAHAKVSEADVIVMWHTLKADTALLARMTKAKAIIRVGVGFDNIDLDAAGGKNTDYWTLIHLV